MRVLKRKKRKLKGLLKTNFKHPEIVMMRTVIETDFRGKRLR